MNILRITFVLVVLCAAFNQSWAQVTQIDKVIAIVDDDVVLFSELDSRIKEIKSRFTADQGQLPPDDILKGQVLERLIIENIQLQIAQKNGIRISDQQISQSFAQVAEGQGMSANELSSEINKQGKTVASVFGDLRRELTIQQVQQLQVNNRIFVSESEVDNFLKSAQGQFWQKPSINLQHIQISLPNNAGPSEVATANSLATMIAEKLDQGEKFETLAMQYSSGAAALEGGHIGWRKTMEFPVEISAALEGASPGTITPPIRSSGGIHILHVIDIRDSNQQEMISQTKTRHILIKPNQIRSNEEARQLVAELRERIINGESFAALAEQYSEDISNSLKGGDLDWVYPDVMVPSFDAAMHATAIGEISPPVETKFGWHILQVDDRREVDMSSRIMRNQVRNILRNQRFPEELDLWTRELRSNAFVSIID